MEDPINRENEIWENPDFSDFSSDEEVLLASIEPSSPFVEQKDEHADEAFGETAYLVDRGLTIEDDAHLARNQIWNADADAGVVITELHAVRKVLFMLQGLPTTLFWRVGCSMEIHKQFCLNHVSVHLLRGILEFFANIALRVDSVRTWLKEP